MEERNPTLAEFEKICGSYIGDSNVVFKSTKDAIVVLEKTHITKTNEGRSLGKFGDSRYAKYRANELKVINIFDRYNPSIKKEKTVSSLRTSFGYKVGTIVKEHEYNDDIEKVCTYGIHYFKTLEAAFYYRIGRYNSVNGVVIKRNSDGKKIEQYFLCGEGIDGVCTRWSGSSNDDYVAAECHYKNDNLDGLYRKWNKNGGLIFHCNYVDDEIHGECQKWYDNGRLKKKSIYEHGKCGSSEKWHENEASIDNVLIHMTT